MSNYVIGITGKSGSGKSTISKMLGVFFENSIVIDVDDIANEGLFQSDILVALIEKHRDDILEKDGKISKDKLGKIAFANRSELKDLEKKIHDYVNQRLCEIISKSNGVIILDWVLLPDNLIWKSCDLKILIESDRDKRKEIVMVRDNISEKYFQDRENADISYDNISVDYKIFNNYDDISTYMNKDLEVVLVECMKQKQIIDEKNFLIKILLLKLEKATLEELREIYKFCSSNEKMINQQNFLKDSNLDEEFIIIGPEDFVKQKKKIPRVAVNSEEAMYWPY